METDDETPSVNSVKKSVSKTIEQTESRLSQEVETIQNNVRKKFETTDPLKSNLARVQDCAIKDFKTIQIQTANQVKNAKTATDNAVKDLFEGKHDKEFRLATEQLLLAFSDKLTQDIRMKLDKDSGFKRRLSSAIDITDHFILPTGKKTLEEIEAENNLRQTIFDYTSRFADDFIAQDKLTKDTINNTKETMNSKIMQLGTNSLQENENITFDDPDKVSKVIHDNIAGFKDKAQSDFAQVDNKVNSTVKSARKTVTGSIGTVARKIFGADIVDVFIDSDSDEEED